MKRFFSVLLVVVLLFSLAVPAFATVPAISALVAVGAVDEPIDEPVIGDVAAVAPAIGDVATNSSFLPVHSPESYLIQSLFDCNIESLRSLFKQYDTGYFFYNKDIKKITSVSLFHSSGLSLSKVTSNEVCLLDYRKNFSFSTVKISNGQFDIKHSNGGTSFFIYTYTTLGSTFSNYIYSFNFNFTYNTQAVHISSTSSNSVVTYAQTGVVPVEPPAPPENPNPDLGGEVTLKEFSNILDNYIADTCAPNGDTAYDLERIKGTTINFSYRNSYGSGSNVISFKDGYVYVNGAKYDFNKNAVDKKKVFGIGKSGIIDTIFSDYDVVTKHIVKFETNKDAKVVLVKKEHFGSYNFDDFPITYSIRPAGTSSPEPDLGDDKTNGFDGDYGVKILMPHNGFKQSKLNAITTKVYYKIPFNGDETKHNIKVSGYVGDSRKTVAHTTNKLENNTIIEGYLDVLGAVNWDTTTPITITVTDYTGKVYTCSVNVLCYSDFVDNDGDGLDDRTNQDEWTGSPDLNKPIVPDNSPPEGSNIIEWFKWFFNSIGEFFATLKSGFDSVISYGGDFSKFLGSAFSYLPSEISVVIGLGFTALVFLRIFGR